MASDCCHKKERLLLPSNDDAAAAAAAQKKSPMMMSINKSVSISETNSKGSASSGSSWSDLSSELGSTETGSDDDDGHGDDFIALLTRQMADYMLEEEEGKGGSSSCGSNNHLEVYKLEDQPSPKDISGYNSRVGGRVKWGELTHRRVHNQQVEQYQTSSHVVVVENNKNKNKKGKAWPVHEQRSHKPKQQQRYPVVAGSGMKAVFLGQNCPESGVSSGTGVFLPRQTGNHPTPTEVSRKRRGCSTVLIPARVLQTLQVHFQDMNKRSQSITTSQSSNVSYASHQPQDDAVIAQSSEPDKCSKELHINNPMNTDDTTTISGSQGMELPPEWTY